MTPWGAFRVLRPGLVPFDDAWDLQRKLAAEVRGGAPPVLVLLEHPAVFTLGKHADVSNLLNPGDIPVRRIDRGGDVTWHGPGQLVGYPIIHLSEHHEDLHWYLRTIEQVLIDALDTFDIPAERNPGKTGVWTRGRKIASIGIHVKQWVTLHGFALNVDPVLGWFELIVPCGIAGVEMTSIARETTGGIPRAAEAAGPGSPLWRRSAAAVIEAFAERFELVAGSHYGAELAAILERSHLHGGVDVPVTTEP